MVEIEFDAAKDAANIAKHGVSLALSTAMDMASALVLLDDRHDYGEVRYRAFGEIEGLAYCLAFTIRPGALRIISLRRAHEKEIARLPK